ncbi:MAG: trypsin-like peptidase domain-containing protein [Limnospira sp.]
MNLKSLLPTLLAATLQGTGLLLLSFPWNGITISTLAETDTATLTPGEINAIAGEITVRIDGPRGGSGVIVEKSDHTYYVLTNWHVVNRVGDYEVVTPDGQRHFVYYSLIERIPELDLAIVPFRSSQRYRVGTFADSDRVDVGSKVYVAGWPRSGSSLGQRLFLSTEGEVTHRQRVRQGYSLVYTNLVRSGMSGGPVLDERGNLIGINGIVQFGLDPDTIAAAAIEINRFLNWRKTATLPSVPTATPEPAAGQETPTVTASLPISPNAETVTSDGGFALAASLREESGQIGAIAVTASYGISGGSDGNVSLWNLGTGGLRESFRAHSGAVNAIAVSRDGKRLATAGDDGAIQIWDLPSGLEMGTFSPRQTLEGHSSEVLAIAMSPDGKTLASGAWDGTVKVWDLETGQLLRSLAGHSQLVGAIAIGRDGQILATGSRDSTVRLWNLQTGEAIRTLEGHELSVLSLAVSPDGEILASGSADGTIALWQLGTGRPIRRLAGHGDGVWSVAIASDNKTLVSGSWDRTVKIWDLSTGEIRGNLQGHTGYVTAIGISPDGQTILSGGWDGQVKVWKRP